MTGFAPGGDPRRILRIADDLVEQGVPLEQALRALRTLEEGGSVLDALDVCAPPARPPGDVQVVVLRSEFAARARARERARART